MLLLFSKSCWWFRYDFLPRWLIAPSCFVHFAVSYSSFKGLLSLLFEAASAFLCSTCFRLCGWCPEDHERFQFTVSMYTHDIPNYRALCMDMLLRQFPDRTTFELVSFFCVFVYLFILVKYEREEMLKQLVTAFTNSDLSCFSQTPPTPILPLSSRFPVLQMLNLFLWCSDLTPWSDFQDFHIVFFLILKINHSELINRVVRWQQMFSLNVNLSFSSHLFIRRLDVKLF